MSVDSQKIKISLPPIYGANSERSAQEIVDEIDLTKEETNTKETFGSLRAKAEARRTPWLIASVLVQAQNGFIDYLDIVELVRKYGVYTKNDFRSVDKTEEIIYESEKNFLQEVYQSPTIFCRKILYPDQELPQYMSVVDIREFVPENSKHSYHIKANDVQASLAIALCGDYVPAGVFQIYHQESQRRDVEGVHLFCYISGKFWNNFIKRLPKETFQKACQQIAEVYP